MARMIRSIERAHRGSARILSLDDYFLQEVSVEEAGKGGMPQRATKLEYQYEADMEAVYMASHLEAVRKTVTEGLFPVMVVDAVNPRQAHLQAFWALAREKGFQTYVVEMPRCLDVAKCADRNVHGWTADGLEKLKEGWEPTPLHMARMVVEGLLGEKAIEEVEMGTEEEEAEKEGEGSGEGRHRGKEGGGDGGGRGVKAGMKRSRWEMEDEEEEGEGDKGTGVRKSEGGGGERAETRAERKVRWREVIDDLAVFDEREEVGCIHRESEHGMRGREGISVMQIRRRQVRRKEVKGKAGGKEGGKEGEVRVDGIRDACSPNPTSMCLLWSLLLSLSTQFPLSLHGGPASGDRPPSIPRPPSHLPFRSSPRIHLAPGDSLLPSIGPCFLSLLRMLKNRGKRRWCRSACLSCSASIGSNASLRRRRGCTTEFTLHLVKTSAMPRPVWLAQNVYMKLLMPMKVAAVVAGGTTPMRRRRDKEFGGTKRWMWGAARHRK